MLRAGEVVVVVPPEHGAPSALEAPQHHTAKQWAHLTPTVRYYVYLVDFVCWRSTYNSHLHCGWSIFGFLMSDVSDSDSATSDAEIHEGTEPEAEFIRHDRLSRLINKFSALMKELVSLATSLHKPKEIRNFLPLLMEDTVQPFFVKFGLSNGEVKLFFAKLAEAWHALPPHRTLDRRPEVVALWSRFMSVVAPIVVVMHARCPPPKPTELF